MSDHQGGYNPPAGYQPQGGYPQQQAGYGTPQGGYPQQQQGGWGQPPGYGQQQQPGYGAPQLRSSGSPRFDLESIKPGGLIAIVSGVLLFVISFFHWYVANVGAICDQLGPLGREACIAQANASGGGLANAWARGITKFALILALLIVIAFVLKAMKVLPANIPVELVAAGILVIADICFLITFISKGVPSEFASIVKRGWPLYVGLLLVLALNAGVIMALLNAGGLSTIKGGIAKIQTAQATSTNTGYGQQQWGQQQQAQQQWGQQPQQQPQQQWGQAPGAQPGAQQGWPSGSQQYQSGQQPQVGPPSGGHPAQPSWGQQPEQPQQGGWPRQEPAQPSWGQPEQPPQQGGWPQQRPEEQQQWPQQPPQQGGWQ